MIDVPPCESDVECRGAGGRPILGFGHALSNRPHVTVGTLHALVGMLAAGSKVRRAKYISMFVCWLNREHR